ncbi:MAG: Gfo/Idh/MocA family oxidoreductase [Lentisphaerae bacterium]|nr:Gfo/Idh/MocA family oxidoreductase [Lentisphaerota bacterium]
MLEGGIIGFGKVGQCMTRMIRESFPGVDITAVCNRSRAKLDIARDEFGITRVTHDPRELCSWKPDFVMVLSSNRAHREHVEAAAAEGLPIFCEKPIATTLEDADAMVSAVEQAGVIHSVNYMLRFLPAFTRMRRLYRDGVLGELLSVTIMRLRGFGLYGSGARHWAVTDTEESGGWIIHHACHGIDFAYWLGGEFESVYAHAHTTLPGSPELVWGMGRLRNGATAVIADSVCAARGQYVAILGTRGQLFLNEGPDSSLALVHEPDGGGSPRTETIPMESKPYPAFFEDSLAHFFECVKTGTHSPCSMREARYSLRVAHAMAESGATGRIVEIAEEAGGQIGLTQTG